MTEEKIVLSAWREKYSGIWIREEKKNNNISALINTFSSHYEIWNIEDIDSEQWNFLKGSNISAIMDCIDSRLINMGYILEDKPQNPKWKITLDYWEQNYSHTWIRTVLGYKDDTRCLINTSTKEIWFWDYNMVPLKEDFDCQDIEFIKEYADEKLIKLGYGYLKQVRKEIPLGETHPCNLGEIDTTPKKVEVYDHPLTRDKVWELYKAGKEDPYSYCHKCKCMKDVCYCEKPPYFRNPLIQDTRYEKPIIYADDQSEPP